MSHALYYRCVEHDFDSEAVVFRLGRVREMFEFLDDRTNLVNVRKTMMAHDLMMGPNNSVVASMNFFAEHPRCDLIVKDEYGIVHYDERIPLSDSGRIDVSLEDIMHMSHTREIARRINERRKKDDLCVRYDFSFHENDETKKAELGIHWSFYKAGNEASAYEHTYL